jgi:hypothetical protein
MNDVHPQEKKDANSKMLRKPPGIETLEELR